MRSRAWTLRMAALLAGASFAVHQLRFAIGYGSRSDAALAHQGHGYLDVLAPVVIGALMIAVAEFTAGLARRRGALRIPPLRRLWLVSAAALVSVYALQELAEGMLAAGHAGGVAGVFGSGGWVAVPLALAVGLIVALLMRGAAAVERAAGRPFRIVSGALPAARMVHRTPARGRLFLGAGAPRAPPAASA